MSSTRAQTTSVVFVDLRVADIDFFRQYLPSGAELVVLDPGRDGAAQMMLLSQRLIHCHGWRKVGRATPPPGQRLFARKSGVLEAHPFAVLDEPAFIDDAK